MFWSSDSFDMRGLGAPGRAVVGRAMLRLLKHLTNKVTSNFVFFYLKVSNK